MANIRLDAGPTAETLGSLDHATLQAFRDGCFRDAWCYDSTGGGWPILDATLKQRPSLAHRLLPWKRVAVELRLGSRTNADPAALVSELATVLRSGNEFCRVAANAAQ